MVGTHGDQSLRLLSISLLQSSSTEQCLGPSIGRKVMGMQSDRKRYKGRRGRWEWKITSEDEQKEKEEGGRGRKM